METRHIDTLIVGAGASGLSLASAVNDRPLVISESPIGGLISNVVKDGFTFDYGGHVYTTADLVTTHLLKQAGARLHENRVAVYRFDRIPYPVQDYASMLGLRAGPKISGKSQVKNFVDYCRNELGDEFTDAFMVPFNKRVWSTDPARMDYDWVEGRVKVSGEDPKKWGMNSSFYYAPGSQIVAVLRESALKNGATFAEGTLISVNEDSHTATFSNRVTKEVFFVKYERLFCTTAYFTTFLRSNFIASIGVGFNHKLEMNPFHWMYCDLKSYVHRITWLNRYYEGMAPEGNDSWLLEIPFGQTLQSEDAYIICNSRDSAEPRREEAARILKNAGLNVDPKEIATTWGAVTKGYPVPTIGSREKVSDLKQRLAKHNIFLAGRWGAHGYFNLQHIFQDADYVVQFAEHMSHQYEYLKSSFYYHPKESVK